MFSESGCGYDQANAGVDPEQCRGDMGQSATPCAGGIEIFRRGVSLWMDR